MAWLPWPLQVGKGSIPSSVSLTGGGAVVNSQTVVVLFERIKPGSQREDRKKALEDLNKLSHTTNTTALTEISKGLDLLVDILKTDKHDTLILTEALEILVNIMKTSENADQDQNIFAQNIDNFIKDKENISQLFHLLEEGDKVKFQTVKLLTTLTCKKLNELQNIVVESRVIPTLVDLLKCSDIIRNETLLFLKELSQQKQEIQTIIMFAGAFEILMDIMKDEQMGNGGIVVQDCLHLLNNLLRDNPINSKSFRENGLIPKFSPLLDLEQSDVILLTEDKTEILLMALETVSLLLTGNNPQDIYTSQTAFHRHSVLEKVLKLGLGGVNNPSIRSNALWTLGQMIRGHADSCSRFRDSHFSSVTHQKPQHAVMRLLSITFSSKVYKERRASLYTLQCYLNGNEDAQLAIASTVTPPPVEHVENSEEAPGRMLLRTITNWETDSDNLRPWYACIMLSFIVNDNRACKEKLTKIQLEISKPGVVSEGLFTKTLRELTKAIKTKADIQIQLGMLRLLSVWIYDCPSAQALFVQSPSHLQFLVELIKERSTNLHVSGLSALVIGCCLFNDKKDTEGDVSSILNTITKDIGIDKYTDCLNKIVKSEDFVNAEQGKHHMSTEDFNKLMFYDYDYTLFFQRVFQQVMLRIRPEPRIKSPITTISYQQNTEISQQLLQQLRDRDQIISELQARLVTYEREATNNGILQTEIAKLREENEDLKTEIKNSKANKSILKSKLTMANQKNLALEQDLHRLQEQLKQNEFTNNTNMGILHTRIEELKVQIEERDRKYAALEAEQDELYVVLGEKSLEIKNYKIRLGEPDEESGEEENKE